MRGVRSAEARRTRRPGQSRGRSVSQGGSSTSVAVGRRGGKIAYCVHALPVVAYGRLQRQAA